MGKNNINREGMIFVSWVVAVGAGPSQVPYIKLLKTWGYRVLATDRQADAPGFAMADKKAVVSTYDPEQSWESVREQLNGEPVAGVIAPCTGEPLRTENFIKSGLNLPALPPESVEGLLHKGLLRERINSISSEPLSYRVVEREEDVEDAARQVGFPLILKPARGGMGGRGVSRVNRKSELPGAFKAARSNSLSYEVVIESYVSGKEYGVTALLYQGHFYVFVVGQAIKDVRLQEIPVGEIIGPGLLPFETVRVMKELLLSACQAFFLENATLNVDMIVDSSGTVHLVEMDFAFADAFDLLATACNYDLRENALRVMLNQEPDHLGLLKKGAAKRYFIHPSPEFVQVEGYEHACAVPGVVRLDLEEELRLKLDMPGNPAYMRGHVLAQGKSARNAENIVAGAMNHLRFIYPAVMLIGMGDNTLPVIHKARQAGLYVVCANRNPAARVFAYSDVSLVIDGKDIESHLAFILADEQAKGIIDVYAGSDLFLTMANILQAVGKNKLTIGAAFAAQNKAVCKLLWQQAGVTAPPAWTVQYREDIKEFIDKIPFPCVVKPVDANSSRGIRQCACLEEVESAVETALRWSGIGKALIEPFVFGRLLDVNGFFDGDAFYRAGIVERWSEGPPFFAVNRAECPANLSSGEEEAVYALFKQATLAVGIKSGPVKADIILTEHGPCILEVAPRFHGIVATLYLIPLALGIDGYNIYFERVKTGKLPSGAFETGASQVAVAKTIRAPGGRIKSIDRLEEAQNIAGVENVFWQKGVGDVVKSCAESNEDIAGYAIVKAADRIAADTALADFFSLLDIKVEPGI